MAESTGNGKLLPLWDHVTELANRLRTWLYVFTLATIVFMVLPADSFFLQNPLAFYKPSISVLLISIRDRLLPSTIQLIPGSLTTPVEIYFVASAFFGFAVSVPVLAYELYKFVDPALREEERRSVYPFVTGFTTLFVVGCLFAFFVLLPFVIFGTVLFFSAVGVTAPFINIDDFYALVFFTIIISGFSFTLPVFLVLLAKFHILSTSVLTRNRKYLWAGVYIMTAIITPDGGPIADLALFIPIILLIEGAVMIAKRYEKGTQVVEPFSETFLRCSFCGGPIDSGGIFCGRCARSRL